jgi:hypothetical protein
MDTILRRSSSHNIYPPPPPNKEDSDEDSFYDVVQIKETLSQKIKMMNFIPDNAQYPWMIMAVRKYSLSQRLQNYHMTK